MSTVKKELFGKIAEWAKIVSEMEEIAKQSGLSENELIENERYGDLLDKSSKIRGEINYWLVVNKFFPFVSLTDKQDKILDIFHEFASRDKGLEGKEIEDYFENRLITFQKELEQRAKNILHLNLTALIDSRTVDLYQEALDCYIFGCFDACCILCRAIAESIAKRYIKNSSHGNLLVGEERDKKERSVPDILKNALSLPEELVGLYAKIGTKADNILHKKDVKATEEDALKSFNLLQSFIKKFPKTL